MIDVKECPYYLVSRATLVITSALKRALSEAGVGQVRPAYLGVLMTLWKRDGLKAVELGREAGLEPSSMTGLLDRMERDGLVARSADPEDRRAHRIHLTEQGREIRGPVIEVVNTALDRLMDEVDPGDLGRVKETLRTVLRNAHRMNES